MRKVGFILGIPLIIIGASAYLYYQTYLLDCPAIAMSAITFSSDVESRCEYVFLIRWGGGVLVIIGSGMVLLGATVKNKKNTF